MSSQKIKQEQQEKMAEGKPGFCEQRRQMADIENHHNRLEACFLLRKPSVFEASRT
jgi:hypothetical protein